LRPFAVLAAEKTARAGRNEMIAKGAINSGE
jgi:hypothetical protein